MPQQPRVWNIYRQFMISPEGWRRWDRAYQALLTRTSPLQKQADEQEAAHENGRLCACVDTAASAEPDHRPTARALAPALPGTAVALAGSTGLSGVICYSGATLRRPGLDRLRDQAATGCFDQVIITAPDRLARKYVHQMLLIEELEGHGCQVYFLERPMSEDPNDQLLLQIRGAVAEYERSLIAERMRRGRQHKYRTGLLLPWTRPPYGYRLDPDHPRDPAGVRVEAAEGAIVSELFARYVQPGQSLSSLSTHLKQLNVPTPTSKKRWSNGTLRRMLTNPVYTGVVYAGRGRVQPAKRRRSALVPVGQRTMTSMPTSKDQWIVVGHIPALVTQESFEQVQAKLKTNQQFARRNNRAHTYLLRALVSCGCCQLACGGANTPALLVLRLCGQIPSESLGSRREMSQSPHSHEAIGCGGVGGSL